MGKQQQKEYYDSIYAIPGRYSGDYRLLPYLPTWALVMQLIANHSNRYINGTRETVVYDIGCGPGQFAQFLTDHVDCRYVGFDFSKEAIAMARQRSYRNVEKVGFFERDLIENPLSKLSPADVYVALETLEHLEGDRAIIASIPVESFIIISVPSFDDPGHVRHFTTERSVMERYGSYLSGAGSHNQQPTVERIRSWFIMYGYRNDMYPLEVSL